MLSRTHLRIDECYNKIKNKGGKEYLGVYKGQKPVGDFQSLFFLNGNKFHMENIKLTDTINFEKVECDKTRKYDEGKGTARRYLYLSPRGDDSEYFTRGMSDDKLGGGKSRFRHKTRGRPKRKRRKTKSSRLSFF